MGGRRVLSAIDLQVPAGSVVGIIGANGVGKSTFIRLLAGLLRPTQGQVLVLGQAPSDHREVRSGIGFVGHRPGLYPDLTAAEHLAFVDRLAGNGEDESRILSALGEHGLESYATVPAGHLSRGTAQRLAIARALLNRPAVVLFDEPFTGLDPVAASVTTRMMRAAAERGAAVVVTAHDQAVLAGLADAAYRLADGRLTSLTPPSGQANRDASAAFIDSKGLYSLPTALQSLSALLWKDLAVEWRARELVPPVLVLTLLCVVVLGYTLGGEPAARPPLAGGALWTAFLFSSTLMFNRLFAVEHEDGAWAVLLAGPTDRGLIFVAKWLAGTIVGLLAMAGLYVAAALTLELPTAHTAARLSILALAASGWSAAGTLAATLTQSAKGRELLVAVVLLPLAMPLVVSVAAAMAAFGAAEAVPAPNPWPFALLLVAYNIIYLVLGYLAFPWAVGD